MAKKGQRSKQADSITPGFHFGSGHGGSTTLLAVKAPIDRASPAAAQGWRLVVRPDVYGRDSKDASGILGWQFAASPYSHYLLGSYVKSSEVADLSRRLDAVVAFYVYEKTSGWEGFYVYDRGEPVESYSWGLDYSEEFAEYAEEMGEEMGERAEPTDEGGKPFDHRIIVTRGDKDVELKYDYRFRSERRKVDAGMVTDEKRMLQTACEFYDLVMPGYEQIPGGIKELVAEAAKEEDFVRVDLLVPPGKDDLDPADARLKEAIEALDVEAVRAAIAAGARLGEVAGVARTSIQHAVAVGKREPKKAAEIVRVLSDAGVDGDVTATEDAETPLLDLFDGLARVSAKVIPLVEALLDADADVNAVGKGLLVKGGTALHRAAMSGSPALVLFLLSRGADPIARNPGGKTPRQAAEETIRAYEKGWPGGDEVVPQIRTVIEHLKAAESGKPASDWREAYGEEVADADSKARQMKVKFAEFGETMKALGKELRAEEAKAKKKAVKKAVAAQPDRFDVRRDDKAKWKDAARRDRAAEALEKQGYERVGTFRVEQIKDLRMFLLHHPGEHVYAVVGEQAGKQWVDLVRYHKDGSTVTVTNAPTDPDARIDRPDHPKRRNGRWGPNKLVDVMRAEPAPKGVVPVKPGEFAKRVEKFLKEEVAWLKKREI